MDKKAGKSSGRTETNGTVEGPASLDDPEVATDRNATQRLTGYPALSRFRDGPGMTRAESNYCSKF